jgi:PhoH-like ATPase
MESKTSTRLYVLDTNVLIHDPQSPLNFKEHAVAIPMVVLEELDHLKTNKQSVSADARQAIRLIDTLLGEAMPDDVKAGVPIIRVDGNPLGTITVLMDHSSDGTHLPDTLNDNKIINQAAALQQALHLQHIDVVLVTKDINMRLKARACGLAAEDYSTDKLVSDVDLLPSGFHKVKGSFWELTTQVETRRQGGDSLHLIDLGEGWKDGPLGGLLVNEFIIDDVEFVGLALEFEGNHLRLLELPKTAMMHTEAWGLKPRDVFQAMALHALLDPDVHLVNLTGAAGSGKTILALAAAIEMTMVKKLFKHIVVTRSVQGLDQEIGFLPGTEAEKMLPWLGAITDNLEALHADDQNTESSIEYLMQKMPIQFKSLNYIRGRSFQDTLLIIDECQNLTPHQMKTIITRAGRGTKVICLGNLAQIDTPYLSAPSSGLTYLTERFKNSNLSVHLTLQGVPRSELAEYAEAHL